MPYENIPGVRGSYVDGAFRTPQGTNQPRILILDSASSGQSYEMFNVSAVGEAEGEFGSNSPLMKGVHECLAQGADNVSVMRIGGKTGSVTITQATPSATLVISPAYRDAQALDRYSLVAESDSLGEQRILLWDSEIESWIYDSAEILVTNSDSIRVVLAETFANWTVGDIADPTAAPTLTALVTGDFTIAHSAGSTIATVTRTVGSDGVNMSLAEKYAALNHAYHILDYQDADFVVPFGVCLDEKNQADGYTPVYAVGVPPTPGTSSDALGLVWQYIYQGSLYTYLIENSSVLSDTATKTVGATTPGRALFTAIDTGPLGEAVTIQFTEGALAVTVLGNAISITLVNGVTTVAALKVAYDAVGAATALATITASTAGALTATLGTAIPLVLDGVLTHANLTGDTVPAEVTERWRSASTSEVRECNFGHQLASFCYKASVTWKDMLGVISTTGPRGFDRISVSEWAGQLPTYTTVGTDSVVASGNNGTGLLGNKFLAGKSGYRDYMVEDGVSTDGYAYGGFVQTVGASLPNGSNHPYGVDEADEVTDIKGVPLDLGKHILITYERLVHRNGFNGGSSYRGNMAATLAAKLALTPENREPIGPKNGLLRKVSDPTKIHATQLDGLAKIRLVGARREEGVGITIISCLTAAHPDSDYRQVSVIRSTNRILQGIRRIVRPYMGEPFNPETLSSLQQACDTYLLAQQKLGFHKGAKILLSFNKRQIILGQLKIKLRMVPPTVLREIDIEMGMAADETDL